MQVQDLSSKDRALLTLIAIMKNASPMINPSYVIEKIEDCFGNSFPEKMLDERNLKTFQQLVEEVK